MLIFNSLFLLRFYHFSVFGDLKSVRLPKKLVGTGTHRGFGFVDFVTKNDAKVSLSLNVVFTFSF